MPDTLHASRAPGHLGAQTRAADTAGSQRPKVLGDRQQHETEVDTEAGMLSGAVSYTHLTLPTIRSV